MRRSRVALTLMATIAVLGSGALFAQFNPTVKVLSRPAGPVPADCFQSVAAAAPRVAIEEPPAATSTAPPPSNDLRAVMHRLQRAAEGDDRAAFTRALEEARTTVASYPAGGEKSEAQRELRKYEDIDKLWSYAETSRTGAFFDATSEGGGLLSMMKRYAGWQAAVADATIEVGGRSMYPTRESRLFLAKSRTGVGQAILPVPSHVAAVAPRVKSKPKAAAEPPHAKAAPPQPVHVPPATTTVAAPRRAPIPTRTAATPPPVPSTKTTTVAPTSPQPPATTTVAAPSPQPATTTAAPPSPQPAKTTTVAPPSPQPATTTTAPPPPQPANANTASTGTLPATTSSAQPAPPSSQSSGGSARVLIAIVLLIVGVGMAIILFRASD